MSSSGKHIPQLHFDDGSRIILDNPSSSSNNVIRPTGTHKNNNVQNHHGHQVITTTANPRGDTPLHIYYEIDRITQEIVNDIIITPSTTVKDMHTDGFLCKVALQFPDELLDDSAQVSWLMEESIVSHYYNKITPFVEKDDDDDWNERDGPSSSLVVSSQRGDETIIPPLVFVLGDTTYASCCPDEIGALHLNADVIVHYGQYACLSVSDRLPVIYSFGVEEWSGEMESCVKAIVEQIEYLRIEQEKGKEERSFSSSSSSSSSSLGVRQENIILVCERRYHAHLGRLSDLLKKEQDIGHVVVGTVPISSGKRNSVGHGAATSGSGTNACCRQESCCDNVPKESCLDQPQQQQQQQQESHEHPSSQDKYLVENTHSCILGGLNVAVPPSKLSQYILVYIGDDTGTSKSRQYLNTLLKCTSPDSQTKSCWSYNPLTQKLSTVQDVASTNLSISRYLNRRFYLTQKAQLANIFGILVGTLSQDRFRHVIASVRHKIIQAGRTCYTLVVGKINVAKIANFAEVECFVLVACGETSVLSDEREFHVPIITPMELDVALGGEKEWGGAASCTTEFRDFLQTCGQGVVGDGGVEQPLRGDEKALQVETHNVDGHGDDDDDEDDANEHDNHQDQDEDDDEPFYSMISGTYVSRPTSLKSKNRNNNIIKEGITNPHQHGTTATENDLSNLPGQGQLTEYHSAAAEFWKKREYKGLEANIGKNDANAAIQGQSGIASDYGK
jgi:diphthamide biosynthesis protein 2